VAGYVILEEMKGAATALRIAGWGARVLACARLRADRRRAVRNILGELMMEGGNWDLLELFELLGEH
jgi:hypothetical protein